MARVDLKDVVIVARHAPPPAQAQHLALPRLPPAQGPAQAAQAQPLALRRVWVDMVQQLVMLVLLSGDSGGSFGPFGVVDVVCWILPQEVQLESDAMNSFHLESITSHE